MVNRLTFVWIFANFLKSPQRTLHLYHLPVLREQVQHVTTPLIMHKLMSFNESHISDLSQPVLMVFLCSTRPIMT